MNYTTLLTTAVTVLSVVLAGAAFTAATRATRLKAASDNRAVDAAAYARATTIYESTIEALRAEVTRLTGEIQEARTEIHQVRLDLAKLQTTNDSLAGQLTQLRDQEHRDLTGYRDRDTGRLSAYDDPPAANEGGGHDPV